MTPGGDDDPEADCPPDCALPAFAAAQGAVVPAGAQIRLGDYTVTVTGFEADADDRFAEREGNPEPPDGRRYAVLAATIRYDGEGEGSTRDVFWSYVVDGVEVGETTCTTVVNGTIANERRTLLPGGEADIEVCVLLPDDAVEDLVIEAFVNGEEPVRFELPTVTPGASREATPTR